jgi:V/A-type H+-transporting ATPase subunit I
MSLRPVSTRWFEVLVLKQDRDQALDCLAQTGAVQLEARAIRVEPPTAMAALVSEYDALASRYRAWWPEPAFRPAGDTAPPGQRVADALTFLRAWAEEAGGTVERLEHSLRKRGDLFILRSLFLRQDTDTPDLAKFLAAGPRLKSLIFHLAPDTQLPALPPDVVSLELEDESGDFLLAMGSQPSMEDLKAILLAQRCRVVLLPGWLPEEPEAAIAEIDRQLRELGESTARDERTLRDLGEKHGLGEALGDVARSKWLGSIVPDVGNTQRLSWITGWTADLDGTQIEHALAECGLSHFTAYPAAPPGHSPPIILSNAPWSRPFEVLTRLLGLPSAEEVDPSAVVSILAPILFGLMFGDVGQGFVLLTAGLYLRRRNPAFGVLISGGVMAMVCGVLFGSVFAREDIIPALWIHPLQQPVTLLIASLGIGAAILLIGLLLDMLQMHWQGRAADWWRNRAGLLLAYLGILATVAFHWTGAAMILAGSIWFVAGAALAQGWKATPSAFGELLEALVQLAVNTLSFARTGAFALAHAGLSVAVIELAKTAGDIGYWPVFVLGNGFVIALEGLVVSIQTTRLILFEFFFRFLRAGGREFRPLKPPHDVNTGLSRKAQ